MRSDVTALRLAASQEAFEKDTLQKSCADLRACVKSVEAENAQLTSVVQQSTQKLSGTLPVEFLRRMIMIPKTESFGAQGRPKPRPSPGGAKCVTKILGGDKITKLGGQNLPFCFKGKLAH